MIYSLLQVLQVLQTSRIICSCLRHNNDDKKQEDPSKPNGFTVNCEKVVPTNPAELHGIKSIYLSNANILTERSEPVCSSSVFIYPAAADTAH